MSLLVADASASVFIQVRCCARTSSRADTLFRCDIENSASGAEFMSNAVIKLVENDLSKLDLSVVFVGKDKPEVLGIDIDVVHDVKGLPSRVELEVEGTQSLASSNNFDCIRITLFDVIGGLEAETSDVDWRIEIDLDP